MSALGTPQQLLSLADRVIVVTGAGGGVGAGIAGRLAAAGAIVVAHTRTSPVTATGPDGTVLDTVVADLTTSTGPGDVIAATLERHGRVDGLVNNAAIQPLARFVDISDAEWEAMVDTNLTAVHRLTQQAARAMARTGGGSIVHIASIEATQPTPVHGHYATTKAALVMHARAAALSLGSERVRVNTVSPGLIDRPGLADDWPEGVDRWLAAAPLGRLGTAEDVGDACVFLCSDLARWITGTELVVDGGVLTRPTW